MSTLGLVRIGLSAGANSAERAIEQAVDAEKAGFTSLWYPGAVSGDPLVQMALAGRATSSIELGTSVLQIYPCHPTLQATRIQSVASAVGRPVTLGVGPSHRPAVEHLGFSYDDVGRFTENYMTTLADAVNGQNPILLAALGPRLLRVAGEVTNGTILWMANAQAIETHVVPRITAAAKNAGRPEARIVAGIPIAVHDDVEEARAAAGEQWQVYGTLPNYQRILAHGGISSPAEAVIVGNEDSVTAQVQACFAAGATDVWAAPFPVGSDRAASRARTRAHLTYLANA
jgi:alkanesulfonate monooxygenase SsuD/methylene tetrahydromethanopterin reductase-like flavin-dependent oxidoreductase (luciferase family)